MKTTFVVAILFALLIANTPKTVFQEFQAVLGLTLPAEKLARGQLVAEQKDQKYGVVFVAAHENVGGINVLMILSDAGGASHTLAFFIKGVEMQDIFTIDSVELSRQGAKVIGITTYCKGKKVFSCKFESVLPPNTVFNNPEARSFGFFYTT